MHANNVFSVVRAWYALRADLQQRSRAVLVGAGAAAALILVANVFSAVVVEYQEDHYAQVLVTPASPGAQAEPALDAVSERSVGFHARFFPLALVVGGLLFTSKLFADLHDKPRAHAYLTLPISTLERWAVRLLVSTIGYAAAALVGYFLVTLLGAGVSQLTWGRSHGIFAPDADAWRTVLAYLVSSSLFLFGAVYFRRWQAFKVILAISGLCLGLALLTAGLAWLVPGDLEIFEQLVTGSSPFVKPIVVGAKILFWGIMGPLFWFLTYRRLSQAEV